MMPSLTALCLLVALVLVTDAAPACLRPLPALTPSLSYARPVYGANVSWRPIRSARWTPLAHRTKDAVGHDDSSAAEPKPAPEDAQPALVRYSFAIQLALASVGFLLSRSPASLMKPKLLQEPGLSIELFSVISSINTMTMAIFSLISGSFIDRFGGLRMLTVQLYGLALCNVAVAVLPRSPAAMVSGAWLSTAVLRGMLACGLSTSSLMAMRAAYPTPSLYADGCNIMAIGTRVGDTASRCFLSAFTSVTGIQSWRAAVLASASIAGVLFLPLLRRCADDVRVAKRARTPVPLLALFAEMVRTPRFLLLAAANGSVGLIAEIVTHWTDLFMFSVAGVSRNNATAVSSIASIVKFAGTFACGLLAKRYADSPHRLLVMQMLPMSMVCLSAMTMLGAMSLTGSATAARTFIMLPMFALLVFGVQIHQDYILRYESLELAPSKDVAARVHTMMGLTLHVAKSVSALVIGQVLKKMSPTVGWQTIFRGMVGTTLVVVAIDIVLSRMAPHKKRDSFAESE